MQLTIIQGISREKKEKLKYKLIQQWLFSLQSTPTSL